MNEQAKPKRTIWDIFFGVVQTAYVTAVISSALLWLCAFMANTPLKAYPGSRFYSEIGPTLFAVILCLFMFGGLWVEFSERAYNSAWVRRCIYLSFAISVLGMIPT